MLIGVPKESLSGETRVAATPDTVGKLLKLGFDVAVQTKAGALSSFDDAAYEQAGAKVVSEKEVWKADIIFKINKPTDAEVELLHEGQTLVSFIQPAQNPELVKKLQEKKVTVLAMDKVPRISRAQSLDALSSTANISGYRAVIEAAHAFGRFFTGQVTAAGKVPPAKVLVIGAGVAGLAAIGTMGGEFLRLDFKEKEDGGPNDGYAKVMSEEFIKAEMELFAKQCKEVDIIITTAAIPGKKSPVLITKEMVASMKSGSVIVDLAALGGGNCEGTVAGKVVTTANGVKMIGYTDLAARLPAQSSQLYSTNLVNLAKLLCKNKDGNIDLDFEDIVINNTTITTDGKMVEPRQISVSAAPQAKAAEAAPAKVEPKKANPAFKLAALACAVVALMLVGAYAPAAFLPHFTVFILAIVVGYYVVWNVTHSLHTPLMSVTNAISGIVVVGAMLQIGTGSWLVGLLAFLGILIVSVNIFGGFAVTRRMLAMFRKQQ